MIKAWELRVGNLIERGGQTVTVGWGTIKAASEGVDVGNPIPLNNEWYLKFGATGTDGAYMSYMIGELELCNDGGHKYFYGNSGPIGMPLLSVHQFQNTYFDLTGKELILK